MKGNRINAPFDSIAGDNGSDSAEQTSAGQSSRNANGRNTKK
jgi:hypothetical protein